MPYFHGAAYHGYFCADRNVDSPARRSGIHRPRDCDQGIDEASRAAGEVRRASRSTDPEVARRAAQVLREYDRLGFSVRAEQIKVAVADRDVDLSVEHLVRYSGKDDLPWQAIVDLGWDGVGVGRERFGRLQRLLDKLLVDRIFSKSNQLVI